MKAQILTGSKSEIAELVARIEGEIRQVIVFFEERADASVASPGADVFAEMTPFMVRAGGADYSRQSIYSRAEGE